MTAPFQVVDEWTEGEAAFFTVVVPEDCPFFGGHFPERPVLPAIGQLAILAELLHRVVGSAFSWNGVDSIRFGRPVGPGERLEIRLEIPGTAPSSRFEVKQGENSISRGTLRLSTGVDR